MATLVTGATVLPMTPGRVVLDDGAVLFDGASIVAVGPAAAVAADPRASGAEVVDATGCAVLPGLHNCHLHSGLLRGTAESLSLWDWLRTYVDPAHRALTPEIAEVASRLCYAESVLAGTTSVRSAGRRSSRWTWRSRPRIAPFSSPSTPTSRSTCARRSTPGPTA